MLVTFTVTFRR